MKIRRHGSGYNFLGDKETGVTFRWGESFQDNPSFAPWPELADISISNYCTKGCDFCYRDSSEKGFFMPLEDYDFVLEELCHPVWGNVFQVAIGGGEPLEHPQFKDIIDLTVSRGIVANLTTNGIHLNKDFAAFLADRVGAIAISTNNLNDLDLGKIMLLNSSSIKTNIHFVLSSKNVCQAIEIMTGQHNDILQRINSLIFLTYKSSGRAIAANRLSFDVNLKKFISVIDKRVAAARIGFDACFVPILLHLTNTKPEMVDSCECGFFSVYIDENLNVKPCSFSTNEANSFSLKLVPFKHIWDEEYSKFRMNSVNRCSRECDNKEHCRGGCPYYDEINFCYSETSKEPLHV